MAQDEFYVLPADAAGQVFDRLAGLQKIISIEAVQQALSDTGRVPGCATGFVCRLRRAKMSRSVIDKCP
jgi:hypothetical protein